MPLSKSGGIMAGTKAIVLLLSHHESGAFLSLLALARPIALVVSPVLQPCNTSNTPHLMDHPRTQPTTDACAHGLRTQSDPPMSTQNMHAKAPAQRYACVPAQRCVRHKFRVRLADRPATKLRGWQARAAMCTPNLAIPMRYLLPKSAAKGR